MQARVFGVSVFLVLLAPLLSSAATLAELQAQLQVLMARVEALKAQQANTAAPATSTGSVQAAGAASSCPNLTRNLSRGMRGADVTQLQQFLISQNILAADSATGFFGAMTEGAVKQFQCGNMQLCSGSPTSNGYGSVGPRTRSAILMSCKGPSSAVPDIKPPPASAASSGNSNTTQPPVSRISPVQGIALSEIPAISYLKRPALIFSLDQAFGNGIAETKDSVGLQRVLDSLQAFKSSHEVYALVSGNHANRDHLRWMLSEIVRKNMPFIVDVYSSDVLTVGKNAINDPYDIAHGRPLSDEELQKLKLDYGESFAGIRIHEAFGENAQIVGCQKLGANWCDTFTQNLPTDSFFQKNIVERYAKFARDNGMFVFLSDHYWAAYAADATLSTLARQSENEKAILDLVKAYPGILVVGFANNEWNEGYRGKIDVWQSVVQPFVAHGAKGFGLSNQPWMCNDENCPASELSSWTVKALAKGALVVETEPYWYWWKFPKGSVGLQQSAYTTDARWLDRGYATTNLQTLAKAISITLSTPVVAARDALAVPATPQGLAHSCITSGTQAVLSWSPVVNATSYWFRVIGISEASCKQNSGWQWISAEGGTCYPDPDTGPAVTSVNFPVTMGMNYTWKVQSSNGKGFSSWATKSFMCG